MALETPILIAVRQGHKEMVVFLLRNGVKRTSGLFYIASKTGWADMKHELRAMGVA
jgi:ankyrin repeat protein